MPTRYETFGPFLLEEAKGETYKSSLKRFWEARSADGSPEALKDAIGVYVWIVTRNGRTLPWNVGRTDRQGFKSRFLQKELSLRRLRDNLRGGEIAVYLLALKTPGGSFRKPTSGSKNLRINDWLETMLIASSRSINSDLRNTSKAKYLKNTVVDGYWNDKSKRRSASAKSLNQLLTIDR